MNLKLASNHHKNIILSIASLLLFAKLVGIVPGKEHSAIVTVIVFALFIWHGISIFMLGKSLNKNKIIWALMGIAAPFTFFITSAVAVVTANKIFKSNNWKVRFYGGATPIKPNPDKNYVIDLDREMEEAGVDNLRDLEEYRERHT